MATSNVSKIRTGRIAIQEQHGTAKTNSQRSPSVSHTPIAKFARTGLTGAGSMALILRQAPAGIVVCDGKRNVTLVNAAARKLVLNGPKGEPITYAPDIWGEMQDPNGCHIPAEESPCMKALLGQTTNGQECCFVRPGDGSFDVLFSAAPITSDQKVIGMIATLFDITQHNDEELQLREDAVSNERNRMAADLHDTLCQSLCAIMLMLNAAEHELADEPEKARSHFRCAHEVAFESLAEARRTMWTLSHESLENEDLAPALSFLAQQFFAGTPVELKLSLQPETGALPLELRRELLRIAREALANVLKHSNATSVHLDLLYQKREVQLSIFDDGHGFVGDPRPGASHGAGLNNMRKRAERMGGKLIINSLPGQGTRLIAALPFSMSMTDRFATESAEHLGAS
jgi:signal transduction histidine kinase